MCTPDIFKMRFLLHIADKKCMEVNRAVFLLMLDLNQLAFFSLCVSGNCVGFQFAFFVFLAIYLHLYRYTI